MDGLKGRLRNAAAAVALVGLGATSVLVLGGGDDDAPSTAEASLALEPLAVPDVTGLDDGLSHHLVFIGEDPPTPMATTPVAAAPDADAAAATVAGDGGIPAIGIDELARISDRLDHLDGDGGADLVAVLTDGTRVPVRLGTTAPAPAPTPATGAAIPDDLAALIDHADVRDVEAIGGGWYAVATTLDEDGFDDLVLELGLDATEDVVVTVASDDEHSELLWGLDNPGGTAFAGITAVEDVDTDGVEARSAQRGVGVVVAVIDSGTVTDHPDLPDLWVNVDENCGNGIDDDGNGYVDDCRGWDFYNGDNTPHDGGVDNSHGTHVAGTIAAVPDNGIGVAGLAPGVTIMNLKALQGGSTWMSRTAEAIRYAVDNGASVINASWGSTGATRAQVPALEAAVEYARQHGVIIVAAAGNAGADLGASPTFPASFPHDNVITVGSHQADGAPSGFSNRSIDQVDLHAPGHYIVSTVPGGYSAKQGTSMAAPHVTAAVALIQATDPGATVSEVRQDLLSTVDRRNDFDDLSATGGTLNAARAIGVEAGVAGAPFEVSVAGLGGLVDGAHRRLSVVSTVRDASVAGGRPIVVRATVLTAIEGVDYGLADLPVTVDGITRQTDDHAQVILTGRMSAGAAGLARGLRTDVELALPAGVYALIFELVDADDPDKAYGPAAAVFTDVPATDDATTPDDHDCHADDDVAASQRSMDDEVSGEALDHHLKAQRDREKADKYQAKADRDRQIWEDTGSESARKSYEKNQAKADKYRQRSEENQRSADDLRRANGGRVPTDDDREEHDDDDEDPDDDDRSTGGVVPDDREDPEDDESSTGGAVPSPDDDTSTGGGVPSPDDDDASTGGATPAPDDDGADGPTTTAPPSAGGQAPRDPGGDQPGHDPRDVSPVGGGGGCPDRDEPSTDDGDGATGPDAPGTTPDDEPGEQPGTAPVNGTPPTGTAGPGTTPTTTPTPVPSTPTPATPTPSTPDGPGTTTPTTITPGTTVPRAPATTVPTTVPSTPGSTVPPTSDGPDPVDVPVTTPVTPAPGVTVPDVTEPVARGGMVLTKVTPSWGPTSGGNLVIVQGRNLPPTPRVYVGGTPAPVTRAGDSSLVIEMPANPIGIYDVTVVDEAGNAAILRLAYVYTPDKPSPGEVFPPGSDAPSDPGPLGDLPDPTPDPSGPAPGGGPAPVDPSTPEVTGPGGGPIDGPTDGTIPGTSPGDSPDGDVITPPGDGPGADEPGSQPTTTTTLVPPVGRPRLVLSSTTTRPHGGLTASRIVEGSPIDIPASAWAERACRRSSCGAELHAWTD